MRDQTHPLDYSCFVRQEEFNSSQKFFVEFLRGIAECRIFEWHEPEIMLRIRIQQPRMDLPFWIEIQSKEVIRPGLRWQIDVNSRPRNPIQRVKLRSEVGIWQQLPQKGERLFVNVPICVHEPSSLSAPLSDPHSVLFAREDSSQQFPPARTAQTPERTLAGLAL